MITDNRIKQINEKQTEVEQRDAWLYRLPTNYPGGGADGGMRGLGAVIIPYSEYDLANTCVSLQSASP